MGSHFYNNISRREEVRGVDGPTTHPRPQTRVADTTDGWVLSRVLLAAYSGEQRPVYAGGQAGGQSCVVSRGGSPGVLLTRPLLPDCILSLAFNAITLVEVFLLLADHSFL